MKKIVLLVLGIAICVNLLSQSVIDVRYNHIASIDSTYIGRQVKIDFKAKAFRNELRNSRSIDTISIIIDDRQINLIEVKGTTADSWIFDGEYLKSYDYDKKYILNIKKILVVGLANDSILFRMTLQLMKNDKDDSKLINSKITEVWIQKAKIEGLLTKR